MWQGFGVEEIWVDEHKRGGAGEWFSDAVGVVIMIVVTVMMHKRLPPNSMILFLLGFTQVGVGRIQSNYRSWVDE